MEIWTSSKLKSKRLRRRLFTHQKTTPMRGARICPEMTHDALQIADLPALTAILEIADDALWFFLKWKFSNHQNQRQNAFVGGDLTAKKRPPHGGAEYAPKRRKTPFKWPTYRPFQTSRKSWMMGYDFFQKKNGNLNIIKNKAKTPK